jgi:hypothetical protein
MDEHTPSTKKPKQTMTMTARAKRQEVSSSFDDVMMKDAAPITFLSRVSSYLASSHLFLIIYHPLTPSSLEKEQSSLRETPSWI